MAKITGVMASTHTPGLLGWFEDAPKDQQEAARKAFAEMRDYMAKCRANVMIIVSNDHLLNWPINNSPDYTVGIGSEHVGPTDWYDSWLGQKEKYHVSGHPGLACHIVNASARLGVSMSYLREMQFDDGISVPTCWLNPDSEISLIPITLNCNIPPIPTSESAYKTGLVLHKVIEEYPGDDRVVLVGSGGLSHEPGGPRYFYIDDDFDRWFMGLIAEGDHEKILRECTLERMEEAGSGGTAELIAWILVMASTQGPAKILNYVKSYSWRCASGWVVWPNVR